MGKKSTSISKHEVIIDRAEEIAKLDAMLAAEYMRSVQIAIKIGGLLAAQKADCKHGTFLQWIEASTNLAVRTAQLYMRMHEKRYELIEQSAATIREAQQYLVTRKRSNPLQIEGNTAPPSLPANNPPPFTPKERAILRAFIDNNIVTEEQAEQAVTIVANERIKLNEEKQRAALDKTKKGKTTITAAAIKLTPAQAKRAERAAKKKGFASLQDLLDKYAQKLTK
jgi:imidazolonepropionase-like amidohydrolase